MSAARAIAAVELRRFLRDRSNIFFVFVFPLLLVGIIGTQFGENAAQDRVVLAGHDGSLRTELEAALRADDVRVDRMAPDAARTDLARGRSDVGVFFDRDAAASFAALDGGETRVEVVVGSRQGAPATLQRVHAAIDRVGRADAQVEALVDAGADDDTAPDALAQARDEVEIPAVQVVDTDDLAREFEGVTGFQLGAVGQTLLFVFLSSLAGSVTLIQARRLGVVRRTLAAPVSPTQALVGQTLGRFAIAIFQGGYIIVATALLFGVGWGSAPLVALIVGMFGLVAAGAAMVIGSLLDDEGPASGIGVGVGLVLAALGGCMLPIELFPDTLQQVAKVTPHAWAYSALADVQRHDAGLVDIAPQLGVLAAMAVAVIVAGAVALGRSLARAL